MPCLEITSGYALDCFQSCDTVNLVCGRHVDSVLFSDVMQARSYVQERGGSCLLVPRRLNFVDTQINVIRNCVKRKKWQKESYKPVAVAVRLRSTPML